MLTHQTIFTMLFFGARLTWSLLFLLAPTLPVATPTPGGGGAAGTPAGVTTIQSFFTNLSHDVVGFFGGAATLALLIAAISYAFAGDNERRVQQAKSAAYVALGGYALALLAFAITDLIGSAMPH